MDSSDATAIVIDNGSSVLKVGFSGDEFPRATFPTTVGRPKYPLAMIGMKTKEAYIGEEAQRSRAILQLKYPISKGIVTNWDDMEMIWHHAFYNELRINPEDHPVLATEAPLNPTANREMIMQIMFETFNVPALYVAIPGVLALYAAGRTTGIVLDSGHGVTHIVPICEGYAIPLGINRVDFAGEQVTEYLARILAERGYSFSTAQNMETVQIMKETLCMVSQTYNQDLKASIATNNFDTCFELPDGQYITLSSERFRAPEIVFKPPLHSNHASGVHESIYNSIHNCPIDLRRDLYSNIILSGGNTMFKGFVDRLTSEINQLFPKSTKTKIIASVERKLAAWIGGSIITSLSCFQDTCVSNAQYQEMGPSIIHRKCL